ncbi:hypothetical protein SETIT_2G020500v2 [Setaria italica]|uniref:Uncharacterized protein n=1 Tax=Setaria italica TaxID=4555 RepID=A0A368PUN7_SETIT|nr:hypothetical protein SETIT_2G020500v2 [Setaria italica]
MDWQVRSRQFLVDAVSNEYRKIKNEENNKPAESMNREWNYSSLPTPVKNQKVNRQSRELNIFISIQNSI